MYVIYTIYVVYTVYTVYLCINRHFLSEDVDRNLLNQRQGPRHSKRGVGMGSKPHGATLRRFRVLFEGGFGRLLL